MEPKFKVGDEVKNKQTGDVGFIGGVFTNTDDNTFNYSISDTADGSALVHWNESDIEAA